MTDILNQAYSIVRDATGIATLAEMVGTPDRDAVLTRVKGIEDACRIIRVAYEEEV